MREPKALPYLLIAPSVLFLTGLFLIPLVQTAMLAFQQGGNWGLGNFTRMADDLNFQDALGNTFKVVLLAVPLQLALALGMTMLLRKVQRGRDLLVWVWSIPLGISDLAAGLVWLAILTDQGWFNSVLFKLGVITQPQAWLTYETPAALLAAIVVAEIWRATAIVFVILLAGVQLLPKEIAGQKIDYIVLDDATDPTQAVRNARKLTSEDHVDALIGSTVVPNSLAMIDVAAETSTPMISMAETRVLRLGYWSLGSNSVATPHPIGTGREATARPAAAAMPGSAGRPSSGRGMDPTDVSPAAAGPLTSLGRMNTWVNGLA